MKSNGRRSSNGRRAPRNPAEVAPPPPSTWATDSEEFREQVQEESRKVFGIRLDEMNLDPDLRDIVYSAVANRLRPDPRDLPSWKPLHIPGFSLSEAVLEERYGSDDRG
ncbi:MAG TPA: hypothetical protein VF541_08280 [Longimicrobium sp.]